MLVVEFLGPLLAHARPQDHSVIRDPLAAAEHDLVAGVGVADVEEGPGRVEPCRVQVGECYGEGGLLVSCQRGDVLDVVERHFSVGGGALVVVVK